MKRSTLVAVLCALAVSLQAQGRAPSNDAITKAALKADLFFLASNDLQGRLTNKRQVRAHRLVHQMSWDLASRDSRPKLAGRATTEM